MTKAEVEKEAEEWLCNNLHSASEEDFIKAMVDFALPREKRIAELEKENAELKIKLKEEGEIVSCNTSCRDKHFEMQDQLTNAKEIIKKMLYVSCNSDVLVQYPNCSEVLQSRVDAEQFIKESEVEK